jgi:hypothetical protein
MLLAELIGTAAMRVDLWLRTRERLQFHRQFPPRAGASPFWPALFLLAIGAGAVLFYRATSSVQLKCDSMPTGAHIAASWGSHYRVGTTPFSVRVPRNTRVQVSVVKDGYAPFSDSMNVESDAKLVFALDASDSESPKPSPPGDYVVP